MSFSPCQPPLQPKSGKLRVAMVVRISTENQDIRSLDDQEALLYHWLSANYRQLSEVTVIRGKGSGQIIDRREALELVDLVESGNIDLILAEDLGRIYRRIEALLFLETCEDRRTRVIALNDNLDTARKDWRMSGMFAALRHESYAKDTSERIRRTNRHRFTQGTWARNLIYGYTRPAGETLIEQIQRDSSAIPIYNEWFDRLDKGAVFAEIADWLNLSGVPVGPYCRSNKWTGTMVGRITRNPILKGVLGT